MRRAAIALCGLLLGGCRPAPAPPAAPAPSLAPSAPVVLRLRPYLGRLKTLTAVVGADTARFLFDTGGGDTFITPGLARRLGCSPAGRSVGFRMSGERVETAFCPEAVLEIDGLPLRHAPVGVFDLMALLPAGVPPLEGIVSLASFADRTVTLELGCGRLVVETDSSAAARVRGMSRLRARFATGPGGAELLAFLAADAGALPLWLLWDSGNLDPVRLAPHAAAMLGAPLAAGDTARVPLAVAGMPADTVPVRIVEMIHDGVLNAEWIEGGIFTLDARRREMWGRPRSGPCPDPGA